jgi:hypothetical protein
MSIAMMTVPHPGAQQEEELYWYKEVIASNGAS